MPKSCSALEPHICLQGWGEMGWVTWEHQYTQCQGGPMAEMDLNQDEISVPLLMLHRDQALCPCESGQHIPMSLPTHPTCMNFFSFSLTRGLAEVGHFLGKLRHEPARVTHSLRALQCLESAPGPIQHPPMEFGIWSSAKGSRGAAAPGAPRWFTRLHPSPQGKIPVSMAAGPASPDVQISIKNKSFSTC